MASTPVDAHLRYGDLDHDTSQQVDGVRPSLQDMNVSLSGTTLLLTFTERLDEDSVPPASAFTVKKTPQGSEEEAVPLSGPPIVAATTVTLNLASSVSDAGADVSVSYATPAEGAGNGLRDEAGNGVADFSGSLAEADTTPPHLQRAVVSGESLIVHFSEALDEKSTPGFFQVGVQGAQDANFLGRHGVCGGNLNIFVVATPWDVHVSGNTVKVFGLGGYRVSKSASGNNFWYIHSVAPDANSLSDLGGNLVKLAEHRHEDLWQSRRLILENATELPTPLYVTVSGNRLTLLFDARLNWNLVPPASAFVLKVDGHSVDLLATDPVAVSGDTLLLTLANPVASGQVVTVSYEPPPTGRLQNVICEHAESFSDLAVTNLTGVAASSVAIASDPGADDTYGLGETIRVRLTFTEAVTVTGTPHLRIDLKPTGGGDKLLFYESGSGTNELTFARKVLRTPPYVPAFVSTTGIAVVADSLRLDGGAIGYVHRPGVPHSWSMTG